MWSSTGFWTRPTAVLQEEFWWSKELLNSGRLNVITYIYQMLTQKFSSIRFNHFSNMSKWKIKQLTATRGARRVINLFTGAVWGQMLVFLTWSLRTSRPQPGIFLTRKHVPQSPDPPPPLRDPVRRLLRYQPRPRPRTGISAVLPG